MSKVILIVLDAFGFDAATKRSGFLEHMTEAGRCAKYPVQGELPSASRPMYETIMTGLPVWQHGVASNNTVRRSRCENLFSWTRKQGLVNAAAAYGWMEELYGSGTPFSVHADRFALEGKGYLVVETPAGIRYTRNIRDFDRLGLRLLGGDTAQLPFVVVTAAVLGLLLLGWRALAAALARRS